MAYYNYKRVVYRDDFIEAKKEVEEKDGEEYENTVDYDGDAWYVTEFLLNKLQEQLEQKDKEIESLKAEVMTHFNDSNSCSSAYGKLKARNEKLERVGEAMNFKESARDLHYKLIEQYDLYDCPVTNSEVRSLIIDVIKKEMNSALDEAVELCIEWRYIKENPRVIAEAIKELKE